MNLGDFYRQLAVGELAQINLNTEGNLSLEHQIKILPQINLGLTELHTRFNLRELRETLIKPIEESYSVLMDSPAYIQVTQVKDSTGNELFIDKRNSEYSVFLPEWNVLEFPKSLPTGQYCVTYRAKHEEILAVWIEELGADRIALPIPDSHVFALEMFVASQLLNPMGFDGDMHEGNNYAIKFERALQSLKTQGLHRHIEEESPIFESNGWI